VKSLGIVRQDFLVKGEKKAERINILFDNGSARSLIESNFANKLTTPHQLPVPVKVTVADDRKVSCRLYCNLIVEIEGKNVLIQPFLIDELSVPLIFGALEMEAYMIKLDLARKKLDLSEFTEYMLAL
jgi:hypothetical protein